jgi:tetratricopeptide (TPR) repeat protein
VRVPLKNAVVPHDVFISYARGASAAAAQRLQGELRAVGIEAFLDVREIPFGAAFPAALADALLDARVVLVFADPRYFERTWCVHELRLLTAAWRAGDPAGLDGVLVALPEQGDIPTATAQLPPPLAAASWPNAGQHEALARLVAERVRCGLPTQRQRLLALNDATVAPMRGGADVPLAWSDAAPAPTDPAPAISLAAGMPTPRGEGLIGRARDLWLLVHECITARAFTPARNVVVRGLGGGGKSLLAAEFVARYASRFFPAGVVWVEVEAGLAGLAQTCSVLWHAMAPAGAPTPQGADLFKALAALARARIPAGRLLWVVDGLPEPGQDAAAGIDAWCPLFHHATVLVTTRRGDTLRGADATLPLGPLAAAAGIELLTRAPVDRRWMEPEEWQEVVRWAGSLPLVLALLREGLVDGSLSIGELKSAPRAEPAATSAKLMQALQGEVDDDSLRGVAQAYGLSLCALEREPALAAAALRIALLAPVALTEALLEAMADSATVGKLVRRGWMQPVDTGTAGRAYTLHRVPASALRERGGDFDAAFAGAFDGLARLFDASDEVWRASRTELQMDVVTRRFLGRAWAPAGSTLAAAERLALAAVLLPHEARRGARFLAAGLAAGTGAAERFVAVLRSHTPETDEAATAALPHILQAMPRSEQVMAWYAQLLADARPRVQRQAIVHAPVVEALTLPVLHAILRAPGPPPMAGTLDWGLDPWISFRPFLAARLLVRGTISELMHALVDGAPFARRRAARLLGELLAANGRDFVAGGYHGPGLVRTLLKFATLTREDEPEIEPPGEDLVVELAQAAARGPNPLDAASWACLCSVVDSAKPELLLRAVGIARHYLLAAMEGDPLTGLHVEHNDEGAVTISANLDGQRRPWPPQVVPQVIEWVLRLPVEPALEAARILTAGHNQGLVEAAAWVHDRLDRREFEPVFRLASALGRVTPDSFINAPWWRAEALVGLGRDEEAVPAFEAVLRVRPDFVPARDELGLACWRIGRGHAARHAFAAALPWFDRAAPLRPGDFNVFHQRALMLYNLGRYDEAALSASRATEIDPQIGEAWFFRAIAQVAAGRPPLAWPDLERAAQLAPDDERITGYMAEIEAWMRANGHLPAT